MILFYYFTRTSAPNYYLGRKGRVDVLWFSLIDIVSLQANDPKNSATEKFDGDLSKPTGPDQPASQSTTKTVRKSSNAEAEIVSAKDAAEEVADYLSSIDKSILKDKKNTQEEDESDSEGRKPVDSSDIENIEGEKQAKEVNQNTKKDAAASE